MNALINWFFDLSLGQAMFFVALVSIILGSFGYSIIHEWIVQGAYDRRQLVLDTNEFEDRDDPYAELNRDYDFDVLFDDIHVEHAKAVLRSRVGAPQLGPEHYTCTKCNHQLNCAFAFDGENVDGCCTMTKI